jgi:hypothetical protein
MRHRIAPQKPVLAVDADSAKGDELERLNGVVDFELFRADLERAAPRSDRKRCSGDTFRLAR